MKKNLIILAVAIAVLMLLEYGTREYFAVGAEIIIAPLCILAMIEYRKWKRGESK